MAQPFNSFGPKTPNQPPRVPLPRGNPFGRSVGGGAGSFDGRPPRDPRKTIWLVIVLLLVGGYFGVAVYKGLARSVYLVNGLDKPYTVSVAGHNYLLDALSHKVISVSEGDITVHVSDPSLGIAPQTCRIVTPFFSRPFLSQTFVINPDRAALVYKEESTYSKGPGGSSSVPPQSHAGELLAQFEGLDYKFEEFPQSISVSSKDSSTIRKTRIDQYTKGTAMERLALIMTVAGESAMEPYVRVYAAAHPEDSQLMSLAVGLMKGDEALALFKPKLAIRPPVIEAHRGYQQIMEQSHPEHDLVAEYRGYLAKEPTNTALLYLLGRVLPDRAEARQLFQQAAEGKPASAHAYNALAYDSMARGEFNEALQFSRKAIALVPGSIEFKVHETEALLALRQFEPLLARVRQQRVSERRDGSYALDEIKLLAQAGRIDEARNAVTAHAASISVNVSGRQSDAAAHFRPRANAAIAAITGDATALDVAAQQMSGEQATVPRFEAAVANNRLEQAAELLQGVKRSPAVNHLALYIAAKQGGKSLLADKELKAAAAEFAKGALDEKAIAKWLTASAPPPADDVCSVITTPQTKTVLLTAMGLRFPKDRARYFAAAKPFNYDKSFPYWVVQKALDAGAPGVPQPR